MFTTWKLTVASIKMFVRNKQALFFTFFTPLLIMVIFGSIGFGNSKINVGVAFQGAINAPTQQFLSELRTISAFNIINGSPAEEQKALLNGDRSIVIDLTNNPFSANPLFINQRTPQTGTLMIQSNAGDAEAPAAVSIIEQVIDNVTIAKAHAPAVVNLSVTDVNSTNLKYIDFLLPGLVALSIMQLGVFSVAFVFVDYKEKGILKRVLATPVKPYQFVTANIITRLIVGVFQAAVFIAIGVIFFKVHIVGNYLLILLVVIIECIAFLCLGFTVSALSKTADSVPAIANLVVFPMLFLGGTFFSIDAMPAWLQAIARVLPLTYFSDALRAIMTKGSGFTDLYGDFIWMIVWAVIFTFIAIFSFRFDDAR
jgi:ABC-2 type transport system permease protein